MHFCCSESRIRFTLDPISYPLHRRKRRGSADQLLFQINIMKRLLSDLLTLSLSLVLTIGYLSAEDPDSNAQKLVDISRLQNPLVIRDGQKAGDVSTVSQDILIQGEAKSVSSVSGSVVVTGTVLGRVKSVSGSVCNYGTVGDNSDDPGNLETVSGSINNYGKVGGEIKSVSGHILDKASGGPDTVTSNNVSTVSGAPNWSQLLSWGPLLGLGFSSLSWTFVWVAIIALTATIFIIFLIPSLLVIFVFESGVLFSVNLLRTRPLLHGLVGGLSWIVYVGTMLLSAILCALLIGIPMVVIFGCLGLGISIYGHAVLHTWLGSAVLKRAGRNHGIFLAFLTGSILLFILCLIPLLGFFVWAVAEAVCWGVAIFSLRENFRPCQPLPMS